jgi:tRNA-dihydrouridine synthase B
MRPELLCSTTFAPRSLNHPVSPGTFLYQVTQQKRFTPWTESDCPLLALAPMQDITDLGFWSVISRLGGPDLYWTEYFRVHRDSRLDPFILESICRNPTGQPAAAQIMGEDIPSLVRAAKELQQHPVAAVDLNLGCPASIVCRKGAGGGLLRQLDKVEAILGALRNVVAIPLTVKTRLGFDSPDDFDRLLALFEKHSIDLVTVHGRTVTQGYSGAVRYDLIGRAAVRLSSPVLANGDVCSAGQALAVIAQTGASGVMIGRGAVRNPWLFEQIRQQHRGHPWRHPTGREVLAYIHALWDVKCLPDTPERLQAQGMKKLLNYIAPGVSPASPFLAEIRRTATKADFFRVCEIYLSHDRPLDLDRAPLTPSPEA